MPRGRDDQHDEVASALICDGFGFTEVPQRDICYLELRARTSPTAGPRAPNGWRALPGFHYDAKAAWPSTTGRKQGASRNSVAVFD